MNQNEINPKHLLNHEPLDEASHADAALADKLADAMIPGFEAEFDPEEAERVGAFNEDALSEADAWDSCIDFDDQG
jgi:hypothetical protein